MADKSWTFDPKLGTHVDARLTITIGDQAWVVKVEISDKRGVVLDTFVFVLQGLWLSVIKATMQ